GSADRPDRASHRRADPMRLVDPELLEEVGCELRVERQLVLVVRIGTPLAEAPADRVRADHMESGRKILGQFIHVAAGACQAMPGNDGAAVLRSPLGVMDFAARAGGVAGVVWHGLHLWFN